MRGNDAVEIGEGSIAVNAGDDAFHSEYLFYIADGTVNVGSCVEGYEAEKIMCMAARPASWQATTA